MTKPAVAIRPREPNQASDEETIIDQWLDDSAPYLSLRTSSDRGRALRTAARLERDR